MTFDMQKICEICVKLDLRYPARSLIDDDYQCALAAEMLPSARDEIKRQANRIAELEESLQRERAIAFSKIQRQRHAITNLCNAKCERGKALVEERARFEYYVQNENCESWPEARRKYPELEKKYIGIAREQLRLEGKL